MWFSFFTNVLTFIVSLILCFTISRNLKSKYFYYFILLTGVSSFIAAFGHLVILDIEWQKGLLLFSRMMNLLAIFCFATGALVHFEYYKKSWLRILNIGLILAALGWVAYANVFTPVMLYGIIGMLLIGLFSFILNFSQSRISHTYITIGVSTIALSALIFALFKHSTAFVASDISHILIATALIILSLGFNKLTFNET